MHHIEPGQGCLAYKFSSNQQSFYKSTDIQCICNSKQIGQFSEDGSVSYSQISLDFACRHCHIPDTGLAKTDEELIEAATEYHNLPQE